MKEETKNEIDLLLRRLGRREETSVSNAAGGHLDADELSAYAENALPAAARSRYTTHLADCSRCRELVVQLSSSVGVVAATESARVSAPSRWKTFLASLFTPMVLRYAAPALGLIVVAAIGFVVLRRQQSARYVTQVTNNEQQSPATAAAPQPSGSVYDNLSADKSKPETRGLVDSPENKQQQQTGPAPPPNAPPAVSVEAEVSKEAAVEQPKPQEQTAAANESPPPAKVAPSATPEESQKKAEIEERQKQVRGVATAAPAAAGKDFRIQQREDSKTHDFAKDKAGATDSVTGLSSVGNVKRDEAKLSANTRTVAGRRFEKKGGVWIDTAYDSSKDSVTVARDSEQYRALVADEPQIKTIADTLEGEIIVVWKGHTYRIR